MAIHHVYIYDAIDPFWGVSSKQVVDEINQAKAENADEIVLHINSPGGSVFEGFAIYNTIRSSGIKVTAKIEGLCASIATLIALAADTVEMGQYSQFMIHNPFMGVEGDADKMRQSAEMLAKIENQLIDAYKRKTKKDEQEIRDLMKAETWFTAEQAKEHGFVDVISEPVAIAALYTNKSKNKMSKDKNSVAAKFEALAAKIQAFIEGEESPKNGMMKLRDSETVLYWAGEEIIEGSTKVFTDEVMETPAPEGDHMLEDGKMITVSADGTVVRVLEPEDSALAALQAENEQLKEQIQNMTAELETVKNSNKEQMSALLTEVENLKKVAIGTPANVKPAAPVRNEKTKPAEPAKWNGMVDFFKSI